MKLKKFLRKTYNYIGHFYSRWILSVLPIRKVRYSIPAYARYLSDWRCYSSLPDSEPLRFIDSSPRVFDRTPTTPFDRHYFYQDIWAFKLIESSQASSHVDIGSRAIFVGMLTAVTDVTFVDIRPLEINLQNLESKKGSILDLPFRDNSIPSLSCLHVAEHIGLGRYGDLLDPQGTKKAAHELSRVLAPGGVLYFSLPVGSPRVCYNAHRIHSPQQILNYFPGLELIEFSVVDDKGNFHRQITPVDYADASYACGLFQFLK